MQFYTDQRKKNLLEQKFQVVIKQTKIICVRNKKADYKDLQLQGIMRRWR
jgi:predicted protein tyrosine phosphatase